MSDFNRTQKIRSRIQRGNLRALHYSMLKDYNPKMKSMTHSSSRKSVKGNKNGHSNMLSQRSFRSQGDHRASNKQIKDAYTKFTRKIQPKPIKNHKSPPSVMLHSQLPGVLSPISNGKAPLSN